MKYISFGELGMKILNKDKLMHNRKCSNFWNCNGQVLFEKATYECFSKSSGKHFCQGLFVEVKKSLREHKAP